MRTKVTLAVSCFGLLVCAAVPTLAHHAFGGEFDPNRPILLKGQVSQVEWVNPHAWIHIAAREVTLGGEKKNLNGATEEWMVEGGTPNTLLRRGITKDSLKVGTEIVVDGYQTRDHSLMRGNGRNITFPDGRKLFLGSSGTGAPTDGADPSEPPKGRGRGGL
jgi:Family of unknown function (DUF6152)